MKKKVQDVIIWYFSNLDMYLGPKVLCWPDGSLGKIAGIIMVVLD